MAALTEDRRGKVRATPAKSYIERPLATGETIFMHSLVSLNGSDELEACAADSPGPVFYNPDQRLAADSEDLLYGVRGADPKARVDYGVVVLLDADDLSTAETGDTVYALDDHTVSLTQTTAEPVVGTIARVVSNTEAWVYIPGIL